MQLTVPLLMQLIFLQGKGKMKQFSSLVRISIPHESNRNEGFFFRNQNAMEHEIMMLHKQVLSACLSQPWTKLGVNTYIRIIEPWVACSAAQPGRCEKFRLRARFPTSFCDEDPIRNHTQTYILFQWKLVANPAYGTYIMRRHASNIGTYIKMAFR